jgi:hypothetical protein
MCIDSIESQGFHNWRILILSDVGEIPEYGYYKQIFPLPTEKVPFHYNLYCNDLKDHVKEGLFFFLDDDDYLLPDSLQKIWYNRSDCMIVQFSRAGWVKPPSSDIARKNFINGGIGLPCLILDAKYNHIADVQAVEDGDFLWICDVISKVDPTWHVDVGHAGVVVGVALLVGLVSRARRAR